MRGLAWIVVGVVLAASGAARAEPSPWKDSRDEDLLVGLVTFGPGDAVHQYFGHNAILIADQRLNLGLLYNFGMFGFGPDMLPSYLTGQLRFWTAATPVQATYEHYVADNRSIHVQELDLAPARRRLLADELNVTVQPQNRDYLYHHYFNNCSTKVRDFIDLAIGGGQFARRWKVPGEHTHRGDTRRYTEHDPVIHMLLMLWMNDSMERPITRYDEAFLPRELARLVSATRYRDEQGAEVRLARLEYTVFEARRAAVPAHPSTTWPALLAVGTAIGLLGLGLAWRLARAGSVPLRVAFGLHQTALGIVLGVPGLVATLLATLTGWEVTYYNETLYFANALTFAAFPLGVAAIFGSRSALRGLGWVWLALGASTLLLLVLKLLPMFDQDVSIPLALFAPVNVGCALGALAHVLLRRARPAPPR